MMELKYFVQTTSDNHNRYYRMIPMGSFFIAEYGRVGAPAVKRRYPMAVWEKRIEEKLAEGYMDQSSLYELKKESPVTYRKIGDQDVERLVMALLRCAGKFFKENYKVSIENVTGRMVEEAEKCLFTLQTETSVDGFNQGLLRLYSVIPRKMQDVREHLLKDMGHSQDVLETEYQMLNLVKGQKRVECRKNDEKNILDAHGLRIRPCNAIELDEIYKLLGKESRKRLDKAFRVTNLRTEKDFRSYCEAVDADEYLYFHGSKSAYWWDILTMGLSCKKAAIGMYGRGIYFANRAKKSIRYTSLRTAGTINGTTDSGYLGIYQVAYRKSLDIVKACPTMSLQMLKQKRCDAVFAHKGVDLINDEIIVYRNEQATVKYLIKLK